MTPGARVAAAIAILDLIAAGSAAERALTNWARASRFAGSGDRAAVRDHVFDALRRWRSSECLGGGASGRARMIGLLRGQGIDPATLFTGEGHAPAPLTAAEAAIPAPPAEVDALDCPAWLAPQLRASLGPDFAPVMRRLRDRAPVFVRVNIARIDRARAIAHLAGDGISARPHPLAETALEITHNARAIQGCAAFRDGLIELQDAASQAVVAALPVSEGMAVLDFCAGGGGKALALAARGARVTAHDADAARMRDLPVRASRAGAVVSVARRADLQRHGFALVLADAPCSGSGAWRRSPEAKWRLTPDRLGALCALQDTVLDDAALHVAPGGVLAYATCSMLDAENAQRVAAFLARAPGWRLKDSLRLTPCDGGDGFYLALLACDRT